MAEENKNGFFVKDDLLRNERILGHSFKQLRVPQSKRKVLI